MRCGSTSERIQNTDFSEQLKRIVTRYKKIYYNMYAWLSVKYGW